MDQAVQLFLQLYLYCDNYASPLGVEWDNLSDILHPDFFPFSPLTVLRRKEFFYWFCCLIPIISSVCWNLYFGNVNSFLVLKTTKHPSFFVSCTSFRCFVNVWSVIGFALFCLLVVFFLFIINTFPLVTLVLLSAQQYEWNSCRWYF